MMPPKKLAPHVQKLLLQAQREEISEYHVYKKLAERLPHSKNRRLLKQMASDEYRHYHIWKKHTGMDVKPNPVMIWRYIFLSRVFGLTFGLKLMEKGEEAAQKNYQIIGRYLKAEAKRIAKDENQHELKLLAMLEEEKLRYAGSIVLGLNDALVELTGALAGFTLALQNGKWIAGAGLITGIAASLSMATSEYLSTRTDANDKKEAKHKIQKKPAKAALYTGIAYLITVLLLIFPYLTIDNVLGSLVWMMGHALIIIFLFSYYLSVTQDMDFGKEFRTMASISFGVSIISFGIGWLVREAMGMEI